MPLPGADPIASQKPPLRSDAPGPPACLRAAPASPPAPTAQPRYLSWAGAQQFPLMGKHSYYFIKLLNNLPEMPIDFLHASVETEVNKSHSSLHYVSVIKNY